MKKLTLGAILGLALMSGSALAASAWTGGDARLTDRGGRLSRFNKRFEGLFKK